MDEIKRLSWDNQELGTIVPGRYLVPSEHIEGQIEILVAKLNEIIEAVNTLKGEPNDPTE